jgi:hypothetical protein
LRSRNKPSPGLPSMFPAGISYSSLISWNQRVGHTLDKDLYSSEPGKMVQGQLLWPPIADEHTSCCPGRSEEYCRIGLAAAARTAAAHAFVATSIAHHDAAADVATRGVSHVDHVGQGVGGVD